MPGAGEILVGVDGSPHSDAAVVWAAAEAASRCTGLMIAHALDANSIGLWTTTASIRRELRELAQPIIDHAIEVANASQPSVHCRGRVLIGSPTRTLLLLSGRVPLVAVGRSGRGSLAQLWLGSVTQRVLAHAACPAVAVGLANESSGRRTLSHVVVGLDDDAVESSVLDFAFDLAARRRVPLDTVHAVPRPGWPAGAPPGADTAHLVEVAKERQTKVLHDWRVRFPGVVVTSTVRVGRPADVLSAACRPDDLLVLGYHRSAPLLPRHLGPAAAAALHDAPCSVAVVHGPTADAAR